MPFYHNKAGRKIFIVNSRPRDYSAGGYIEDDPAIPRKDINEDTIMSKLEYDSLVVPKPVAWMMKYYPGEIMGEKETDPSKLADTIVMPHEIVVDKIHAPKVEKWLKKHGITLPIPETTKIGKKMYPTKKCGGRVCRLCSRYIN
jgi:hypothetical protein